MTSPGLSSQPNLLLISLSCDLSSSLCHWTMAWRSPWTMVAWWPLPFSQIPSFFWCFSFLGWAHLFLCLQLLPVWWWLLSNLDCFPDTRPIFLNVWNGHLYFVFLCHLQVTRPQVQLTLILFLLFPIFFLGEWPHPFNCLGEKILCHPRLLLLYQPSSQILVHLLPLDNKLFFLLSLSWYNFLAFLIWP